MSWEIYVGPVAPEEFDAAADAVLAAAKIEEQNPAGVEPAKAAVEAAKALVPQIAASGRQVQAVLSGHANPGRLATSEWWGSYSITVQVFQWWEDEEE